MTDVTDRQARRFAALALSSTVAACGGSAVTAAGSESDSSVAPVDATAGSDAGHDREGGGGVESGGDAPVMVACTMGSECPSGYCKAGLCLPCALDAQCGAGQFCDAMVGICKSTRSNGQPCAGADQCTSGFCADDVCCDNACSGSCQACNLAGAVGICSLVPPGMNGASHPCAAGEVCCPQGYLTACTDTQTSVNNCGGCEQRCPSPGGGGSCQSASCSAGLCTTTLDPQGSPCGDGGTCSATGVCL